MNVIENVRLVEVDGYFPVIQYYKIDYFLGKKRYTPSQVCRSFFIFQKEIGEDPVPFAEYDSLGLALKSL